VIRHCFIIFSAEILPGLKDSAVRVFRRQSVAAASSQSVGKEAAGESLPGEIGMELIDDIIDLLIGQVWMGADVKAISVDPSGNRVLIFDIPDRSI